jgi:hypothetical protein
MLYPFACYSLRNLRTLSSNDSLAWEVTEHAPLVDEPECGNGADFKSLWGRCSSYPPGIVASQQFSNEWRAFYLKAQS